MAVLRAVLNNDECLFFPGSPKDKKKSRALWVKKVENIPAHFLYQRGIEEPNQETLEWIQKSPFAKNLILHKNTGVTSVRKEGELFRVFDSKGSSHLTRFIVLCTGVMDVQPEINGTIETVFDYANSQTIDYCLICDGHHVLNKKASVIGHGNGAAWVAIMLYERYRPERLSILTNGKQKEFQTDTQKLIEAYGIEVFEAPIVEVIGKERGKVLEAFKLQSGEIVTTDLSFVALGMIVYNGLAKELRADLDERGFVKADESGATSVPGLYVAGDLKAGTKKQIYTSWDTAVNAVNAINMKLRIFRRPTSEV